jgi:predicted dehydrogenase
VRVALFGAGAMGAVHAAAWQRVDGVELVAVVGRSLSRARDLAARVHAPAFTDPAPVLDDASIDAVDLTVPTAFHRDLAIAALERGKHVLCETPLAPSVADADAMIAAARRAGRRLQVAQLVRLAEPNVEVRDLVRAGALGRPLVVSCERLWPGLDALDDPADHHGDAVDELALFDLDWLLWCFGLPDTVAAHASVTSTARVDHVLIALEFGGVRAFVEASLRLPTSFPFRLATRVVCEDATVEWTVRFQPAGPPDVIFSRHPRRGAAETRTPSGPDPYHAECRHFARMLRGDGDTALLDAAGARDGLRIVAAVRASLARDGARVGLDGA